jgi:hypothetical protein
MARFFPVTDRLYLATMVLEEPINGARTGVV